MSESKDCTCYKAPNMRDIPCRGCRVQIARALRARYNVPAPRPVSDAMRESMAGARFVRAYNSSVARDAAIPLIAYSSSNESE